MPRQSGQDHRGCCPDLDIHAQRLNLGAQTKTVAVEDLARRQLPTAGLAQLVSRGQHGNLEGPKDTDSINTDRGQQANVLRLDAMP